MSNKPSSDANPEKEAVFKSGSGWVYRIPALFHYKGTKTLLAFAERRKTKDDTSTKNLVMKTGELKDIAGEAKIEWSELKLVKKAHLEGYRPMNPCPVYEKTSETLFLFFICVKGTCKESDQIYWNCNKARLCYITTKDKGHSWSKVTDLTDELGGIKNWATFAVGPGHGLQTEADRMIVPAYAYVSSGCSCFCCCFSRPKAAPHALPLYSDDKGTTWKLGEMLKNESLECQMEEIFEDDNKSYIYCNARTGGKYRVEAFSSDENLHFTPSNDKSLQETGGGCQGSVVSFPAQSGDAQADGEQGQSQNKWLLFTHPSHKSDRAKLGVFLNKTPKQPNAWSKAWIINDGPSGYSDLAYTGDGRFVCLMECGKHAITEEIASVILSYKQVEQKICD